MAPALTAIKQDDTHRLIPWRYSEPGESVLSRIADDEAELEELFEIEAATNPRLVAEQTGLPGISKEVVFGVPYAPIINGCFTHPNPNGGRFNDATRGAWYAAFGLETSQAEVAYHRLKELEEVNWVEEEVSPYVDYLADFRADFHDIRADASNADCLDPNSYAKSQQLARSLLTSGSAGIVYPSVRHSGGTCLACFRPLLVMNVRKGREVTFTFRDGRILETSVS